MLCCFRQSRDADGEMSPGRCERATGYDEREVRAETKKKQTQKTDGFECYFFASGREQKVK